MILSPATLLPQESPLEYQDRSREWEDEEAPASDVESVRYPMDRQPNCENFTMRSNVLNNCFLASFLTQELDFRLLEAFDSNYSCLKGIHRSLSFLLASGKSMNDLQTSTLSRIAWQCCRTTTLRCKVKRRRMIVIEEDLVLIYLETHKNFF
jgi:hypothetical protein